MKFLVFALCMCAASAASFGGYGGYKSYQPTYQPVQQTAKVFAQTVFTPAVVSGGAVAAKTAYNAGQAVAATPVVAAKTVYTAGKEAEAAILRADSDVTSDGFSYNYETSNQIASQVSGILRKVDNTDAIVYQGSYQYVAPDGTPIQVSFVADENGYQPRSDILPVAPPVPEAIVRSLEYIRTHPPKSEKY